MSRGWLGYSKTGLFYGLYYPTAGCAVNDIQPPVAAVIVTLPIVAESNSAFFFDVAPLPPFQLRVRPLRPHPQPTASPSPSSPEASTAEDLAGAPRCRRRPRKLKS
jgi:hypothetical protein